MTDEGDAGALSTTEAMTGRDSEETVTFAEWRAQRPFWAGVAMVAGGLVIAYPSLDFLMETSLLRGESIVSLGIVVGALIVFLGVGVLLRPEHSTGIGLATLVLAAASFVVAFGGLLVGMLLAGLGGVLSFAWRPPRTDPPLPAEE
jgi:hypothetical protein